MKPVNPLVSKHASSPAIEPVLPLINVVFLLLIFFLMTGKLQNPTERDIVVPKQSNEQNSIDSQANDWLYINEAGVMRFQGEEIVSLEALKENLKDEPVVIFADGNIKGKKLNEVIFRLKEAGINTLSIATEKVAK